MNVCASTCDGAVFAMVTLLDVRAQHQPQPRSTSQQIDSLQTSTATEFLLTHVLAGALFRHATCGRSTRRTRANSTARTRGRAPEIAPNLARADKGTPAQQEDVRRRAQRRTCQRPRPTSW